MISFLHALGHNICSYEDLGRTLLNLLMYIQASSLLIPGMSGVFTSSFCKFHPVSTIVGRWSSASAFLHVVVGLVIVNESPMIMFA